MTYKENLDALDQDFDEECVNWEDEIYDDQCIKLNKWIY